MAVGRVVGGPTFVNHVFPDVAVVVEERHDHRSLIVHVAAQHRLPEHVEVNTLPAPVEVQRHRDVGERVADDGPVIVEVDFTVGFAVGAREIGEFQVAGTRAALARHGAPFFELVDTVLQGHRGVAVVLPREVVELVDAGHPVAVVGAHGMTLHLNDGQRGVDHGADAF